MALINGRLTSKSGYLPTEVLSEIFRGCLELDEHGCAIPCPHQAPLILTWVCRLWRTIALNTHRLWEGVILVRKANRINDSRRLLELWIRRSGSLPFGVKLANVVEENEPVVSFHSRIETDPAVSEGLKDFIDTLLGCSERWRVLDVAVPDGSFAAPLLDAVITKAQGLEHLCLSLQYLGVGDAPYRYNFSQNTSLRSVRLLAPPIVPFPEANNQGFSNLVVLGLHFCPSVENCLTWLDMTPNLESLALRLFSTGQRTIFQPDWHIRRLPHLKNLEITCFSAFSQGDNPVRLLDILDAPALVDFELDLNHMFDDSPFHYVRDLFTLSGVNLERLCLSGTHMSEGEVVECLRLSPDLAWFECEVISDVILQALTPRLTSEDNRATNSDPTQMSSGDSGANNFAGSRDNNTSVTSAPEDPDRYTVMCPKLRYFESEYVDACSLQAIYAMIVSRCEDIYEGITEYVDTDAIQPTPDMFKTLYSIILPCDPVYGVLDHRQILEGYERTVYF